MGVSAADVGIYQLQSLFVASRRGSQSEIRGERVIWQPHHQRRERQIYLQGIGGAGATHCLQPRLCPAEGAWGTNGRTGYGADAALRFGWALSRVVALDRKGDDMGG